MEKLYLSEYLNPDKDYKLFCPVVNNEKLYWYYEQLCALNDYAYYITECINNKSKEYDEAMKEILEYMQNEEVNDESFDKNDWFDQYDPVVDYLGTEERKILWLGITEPISKNSIIMNFISFAEGTIKEMTYDFVKKLKIHHKMNNINIIENCLKSISFYYKKDLTKKLQKEIDVIKQAKKVRNSFTHEQWITIRKNVWDFKTREQLEKISIVELINSISNILLTLERFGIEVGVYSID